MEEVVLDAEEATQVAAFSIPCRVQPHNPPGYVRSWFKMVFKALRSLLHFGPRLKRKVVSLYESFVNTSLKKHFFPAIMEKLIFFNFWKAPFLVDLKNPESCIPHTVNFYIKPENGITLGVWHIVPESRGEEAKGKDRSWYEQALQDGNPIIVYLHGSAENRASSHRVKLLKVCFGIAQVFHCQTFEGVEIDDAFSTQLLEFEGNNFYLTKVLSEGGFHVLALDYRGFGDSTGKPTEEGLTRDAIYLYDWTKARSGTTPVCLWGHSLGTGVATNAAKTLEERGLPVDAIVLEAPFTNIHDASANYPILKMYRKLPGFVHLFLDALIVDKIVFPNDENVKLLSSPLLILHAEDDKTVPLEIGKKVYEIAHNAYKNKERVKMVIFPAGFRHNFICKNPRLAMIVRDFLSKQWA